MTDILLRSRIEVAELPARWGWYYDHCEWSKMHDVFTDKILLDYTSLNGGEPMTVARKDVIDKWQQNREGLAATQHLISNQIVVDLTDEAATVTAMFQATHLLPNPYGGPTWTLGGRYTYGMVREDNWRIASVTMDIIWADGNRHIRDLALEKQ